MELIKVICGISVCFHGNTVKQRLAADSYFNKPLIMQLPESDRECNQHQYMAIRHRTPPGYVIFSFNTSN